MYGRSRTGERSSRQLEPPDTKGANSVSVALAERLHPIASPGIPFPGVDAATDVEVLAPHMESSVPLSRQQYLAWVEDQIEDYKCSLTRDDLLSLADIAVQGLLAAPDGQYALTEILVCDAVDRIIFRRLKLPTYRRWQRLCQTNTGMRPPERADDASADGRESL